MIDHPAHCKRETYKLWKLQKRSEYGNSWPSYAHLLLHLKQEFLHQARFQGWMVSGRRQCILMVKHTAFRTWVTRVQLLVLSLTCVNFCQLLPCLTFLVYKSKVVIVPASRKFGDFERMHVKCLARCSAHAMLSLGVCCRCHYSEN